MQQLENNVCKLPDRTKEIQSIVHRFSCSGHKLQRRIQHTLESGDEGMSLSREFDTPSFYLEWVYKKLPPAHQETFQRTTLAILDSLTAHPDSSMSAESADELLLMLHGVFRSDSPTRPHAIEDLKTIIANDKTRTICTQVAPDITVTLHERAVQMLVGFNSKEPLSFWNQLVETYGDSYAGLASQGVFNFDFDAGVQWLLDHKDLQKVLSVFSQCLPYYYETRFGMDRCDNAINTIVPRVSKKYAQGLRREQQRIKDWLERESKSKC